MCSTIRAQKQAIEGYNIPWVVIISYLGRRGGGIGEGFRKTIPAGQI